jgi:hypothetical protein
VNQNAAARLCAFDCGSVPLGPYRPEAGGRVADDESPQRQCWGHVDTWVVNFHGEHGAQGSQVPLNRVAHIDPVTGITLLPIIVKIVIGDTARETVPS